jgi:hypothetical protein
MAKRMKVAAAAVLTTPDDRGRYTRGLRGEIIEVDTTDPAVRDAIDRGHLIGVDEPLPDPSSPAKQRQSAAAATAPAATVEKPAAPPAEPTTVAEAVDANADVALAYADAHPDQLQALLAAEKAGKDRSGVTGELEKRIAAAAAG